MQTLHNISQCPCRTICPCTSRTCICSNIRSPAALGAKGIIDSRLFAGLGLINGIFCLFQGVLGVLDIPVIVEGHLDGLGQVEVDSAIGRYAADDDDRIDFLILCPLVSCLFSALSGIVSDFLSQFFAQFRRNVDRADSIGGFLSLGFGSGSLPLLGLFGLDFLLFCLGPGLDAFGLS